MQRIIDAENSDLFDVLAHIAYTAAPMSRAERAETAKAAIGAHFEVRQRAFLEFVLSHYVSVGVEELSENKLPPLLRLKYKTIADALADLGTAREVRRAFIGFQRWLYTDAADIDAAGPAVR